MEFSPLFQIILLVIIVFGAVATKVALVTGIEPLYVAVYLALLIAFFSLAVHLSLSRSHERAQRDQLLESCWAQAAEQQKLSAAEIKDLQRDYMKAVSALKEKNRSLELRLTDLSTCYKSSQQDVTRLQASLRQAMTWTVDSGRVENAKKIESQWYLLRDIMVEGGIQASNEYEWVCAIRKLVQRKPAPSTPTGVVSADLEKAREDLAKETAAKNAAQYKIGRLENQNTIASKTVRIQELDLEELKYQNELKQRIIDDLKEQLSASHQKDSTGCHEKLAQLQKQLRTEQKKSKDAEDSVRAKSRTMKDHAKNLKKLHDQEDSLIEENKELQQKLADCQAAGKQKDATLAEKELEITEHKTLIEHQKTQMAEVESQFTELVHERVKEHTSQLEKDLEASQEERLSAMQDLTTAQESLTSANMKDTQQAMKIFNLEKEKYDLGRDLQSANGNISNGNDTLACMKRKLEDLTNDSEKKDSEISNLQALVQQLKGQISQLTISPGNGAVPAPFPAMSQEEFDAFFNECQQAGLEMGSKFTPEEIDEATAINTTFSQPQLSTNDIMAQNFNIGNSTGNFLPGVASGGDDFSQLDLSDWINNDLAPGLNITDEPEWDDFFNFNNANPATGQDHVDQGMPQPDTTAATFVPGYSEHETMNNPDAGSDALPPPEGRKRRLELE